MSAQLMERMPWMAGQKFPIFGEGLEALLWPSCLPEADSAWHGHVSFAHWMVQTAKPKLVVELGTHNGVSFSAFCNAVMRTQLPTQCFAVDTWQGDAHAGHYGEEVFDNLSRFVGERFASCGTLLRCYFDEALPRFEDGSVDLLHIDGLHTYAAVKHDFDTWLPKMSKQGVILFHDTMIHDGDFAVWQLWDELSKRYPAFNFAHSAGLGVLAVGSTLPDSVAALCGVVEPGAIETVRRSFVLASEAAQASGLNALRLEEARRTQELGIVGTNIARECRSCQSSVFEDGVVVPAFGAVSGFRTGRYGFHTAMEADPWWMVDLGGVKTFDEVIVFNRLEIACVARSRFIIALTSLDGESWTVLYRHDGTPFGGIDGRPLRIGCAGTKARFVRLKLPGTEYLHLDQVEIYAHPVP